MDVHVVLWLFEQWEVCNVWWAMWHLRKTCEHCRHHCDRAFSDIFAIRSTTMDTWGRIFRLRNAVLDFAEQIYLPPPKEKNLHNLDFWSSSSSSAYNLQWQAGLQSSDSVMAPITQTHNVLHTLRGVRWAHSGRHWAVQSVLLEVIWDGWWYFSWSNIDPTSKCASFSHRWLLLHRYDSLLT